MELTKEQKDIVDTIVGAEHSLIKVNAKAGTAKSTTAALCAKAVDGKKLVVSYTKVAVTEAVKKFGKDVKVKTINAIAYRHIISRCSYHRQANPTKRKAGSRVVNPTFGIADLKQFDGTYERKFRLLTEFNDFCKSYKSFAQFDWSSTEIKDAAIKLFSQMVYKEIQCSFDFTVKYYYMLLKEGRIKPVKQDILILDEAQDVSEVMLAIFMTMPAKVRLLLGDEQQAIYQFNNSVNAFELLANKGMELYLTKSFRTCATIVASIAKHFGVAYVGTTNPDMSNKTVGYLTISNRELIHYILSMDDFSLTRAPSNIFAGLLPLLEINEPSSPYFNDVIAYERLLQQGETKHRSVYAYLQDIYAFNANLVTLLGTVMIYGKQSLLAAYKKATRLYRSNKSNVILSTVHSAKGMSIGKVIITPELDDAYKENMDDVEMQNLYYVAVTRAIHTLEGATALEV